MARAPGGPSSRRRLEHSFVSKSFVRLFAVVLMIVEYTQAASSDPLSTDFYNASCPKMEDIVRHVTNMKFNTAGSIVLPSILRLFFHDCIVDGCDGSVLISSTDGNVAERDAVPNLSLAGDAFDTIFKAKVALEKQCPGVVSCADILAVATRDVVVLARGPTWNVAKGRRDGLISLASHANEMLPSSHSDVNQLTKAFVHVNLTRTDMIALCGAHTIGFSHCDHIHDRLYNFSGTTGLTDPTMNSTYAENLKQNCNTTDPTVVLPFDVSTPFLFDNMYYTNLRQGQGLLTSDQVLYSNDNRTRKLVTAFSKNQTSFFGAFVTAMIKLGNVGVLTGKQGEIRKDCAAFN